MKPLSCLILALLLALPANAATATTGITGLLYLNLNQAYGVYWLDSTGTIPIKQTRAVNNGKATTHQTYTAALHIPSNGGIQYGNYGSMTYLLQLWSGKKFPQ